jgi:serine/threonine-protein kinase
VSNASDGRTNTTLKDGPRSRARAAAQEAPARLEPGDQIGRFRIIDVIGEGGMGVVYGAEDAELGRRVAIKVLSVRGESTDGGSNRSVVEARLMREAQALARLNHPNVIAIYDVGRHDDHTFVAMELVEGESLNRWWRREPRHSRAEVLSVLMQAGQGLAAVHSVGLVHRDFKPDNVIVGSDGRVRVLDFGLARATGRASMPSLEARIAADAETTQPLAGDPAASSADAMIHAAQSLSDLREAAAASSLLDSPLTQAGLVVGTPRFMAPEQHRGGETDARTDQFSFCVALYRVLYEELPFEGEDVLEYRKNVLAGRIREPRAGADVPMWLRRVVVRGLAVDREQRFPTMNDLLAALADDPEVKARRRIRLAAVLGGTAALAIAGTWAIVDQRREHDPCVTAANELGDAWDAQRRAAIERRFTSSGRSHALDTFIRVVTALDSYAGGWRAMREESCRATRKAGRQSQLVYDLRVSCLDRRRAALSALTDVFANKLDDEVLDRAVEAVAALPALSACADIAALTATVPLPDDPVLRANIAATNSELDRAEALHAAGKYADEAPLVATALPRARLLSYPPLLARALLASGSSAISRDNVAAGEQHFVDAARAAAAAHDDVATLKAWEGITQARFNAGQYDDALALRLQLEIALARIGNDRDERAEVLMILADVLWQKARFPEARALSEEAVALRERLYGKDSAQFADATGQLGNLLAEMGEFAEARTLLERSLAATSRALGPRHPRTGLALNDLAMTVRDLGDYRASLELFDQALAIQLEAHGPESVSVGRVWNNLAGVRDALDRPDAKDAFLRAIAIKEKSMGPEHPSLALSLLNLGSHLYQRGVPAEAEPHLQRALTIQEKALGPDHPETAFSRYQLGAIRCTLRHYADGEKLLQQAIDSMAKSLGPDHFDVSRPVSSLASCRAAHVGPAAALPLYERVLAIRLSNPGKAASLAEVQWSIAHTLMVLRRDRPRALTLARAAVDNFRKADTDTTRTVADRIAGWLDRGAPAAQLPPD